MTAAASSWVVRSTRVLLPSGLQPAAVHIRDGRIAAVDGPRSTPGTRVLDAGDLVVMPGLVDTHVHVNEPGRTDWEGFASATRAAAAGGVTTIVDMPLNCLPATTTAAALREKVRAASGQCHVDVGFWGGVVPGNAGDLVELARAGALGFKCFLSPSGVDEFAHVDEADLRQALPHIAALGLPLLVHAELPSALRDPRGDPRDYRTWLASRPADAEHAAIRLLIGLAREYRTHIHVVHVATAGAGAILREARAAGVPITAETCQHYLTFAADDIQAGQTVYKCAPPIREGRHREAIWNALAAGDLDLVATDHSPAPAAIKHLDDGDFVRAWGGISSLQLAWAALWTGAKARGLALASVVPWVTIAPARLAGLDRRKGAIAAGRDADLVLMDPDAVFGVNPARLHHRHPLTPYAGMALHGRIHTTILRGEVVFDRNGLGPPRGACLVGSRATA
jgi:allantoinase